MRRGLAFGAWVLLAWSAGQAVAGPSASGPSASDQILKPSQASRHIITNPDWLERPSGEEVASVYPPLAQILSLSGRAVITCAVNATGGLVGCAIVDEIPTGFGFGEAALRMSNTFKMRPQMVDGVPVSGEVVNIPIHFTIAEQAEDSRPAEASLAPAPSPNALAMARRLVMASYDENEAAAMIKGAVAQFHDLSSSSHLSAEQKLALSVVEDAVKAALPDAMGSLARRYATTMPEPQLAQAVAFMESPAGKAFASMWTATNADGARLAESVQRAMLRDARARLCLQIRCLGKSAVPPPPGAPK